MRIMPGVYYDSDYYGSLRMNGRIGDGIFLKQAHGHGGTLEMTSKSVDGDLITIAGSGGSCPSLWIIEHAVRLVQPDHWSLRHVSGRSLYEDLG